MSPTSAQRLPVTHRLRVGMPFPPDKRQRVTQTSASPWCTTGLVTATFPDGTEGESTGFAIGERHVVTAAHAVYDKDLGGLATKVKFQPGRDAANLPFNTFTAAKWHVLDVYRDKDLTRDDYSLLVLSASMPAAVGRYQLTAADDSTLRGNEWQIAGYPDDKTPENSMWYAAGALAAVDQHLLQYRISTSAGQSGAAVAGYQAVSDTKAVGIHSRVNDDRTANLAVRVTPQVIKQIEEWKAR
ncbi:trypsin-like serine peptidase [Amycolatopsis pithecellobii]|uniref:Serine protease n=1 Tax=Amycolatopsis pithecellobii TaxID=664692 RepID=A0A6N7Z2P0_9PSEU|nr:trypsin-like peptidase domain-containing protein [Amycolatopsis pithecellobii]MTD54220.1 trypsin-like serine protease [Amycolatopsis pithecellobii]